MLKILYIKILDALFPTECMGCKTNGIIFCDKCIDKHLYTIEPADSKIISIFNYRDSVIKDTIWKFKYTGDKRIGTVFGQILYDKILEEISERSIFSNFNAPLLIPIPLSKKRQQERGFNQSELIARAMSVIDNNESFSFTPNVLYKIKDTPNQTKTKNRQQRMKNLNGCFEIKDKSLVHNKNIILIDDITTTGATIHEASKTLAEAGARQIIAFTVAH